MQAVQGGEAEALPEDDGSDIDFEAAFDQAFGALGSIPEDGQADGKRMSPSSSLHMTLRDRWVPGPGDTMLPVLMLQQLGVCEFLVMSASMALQVT